MYVSIFRNYFNMRYESGVEDKLCLKGYCIKQCDSIQKDGYNCGVIALKVCILRFLDKLPKP